MGKTKCIQCFLSFGLPSSAYEQLKCSPRSILFCVCQMRVHSITQFSCMRSQEQSSPAFPFLPWPRIISCNYSLGCHQWYTLVGSHRSIMIPDVCSNHISSSVKPECQLPLQGKTCCSICGAEAEHLGRKSTQVCYKTQQGRCARRTNRQILV